MTSMPLGKAAVGTGAYMRFPQRSPDQCDNLPNFRSLGEYDQCQRFPPQTLFFSKIKGVKDSLQAGHPPINALNEKF